MKEQNTYQLFQRLWAVIQPQRKRQLTLLFLGSMFIALWEAATAGVIALFAAAITSQQAVLTSSFFTKIQAAVPAISQLTPSELLVGIGCLAMFMVASRNVLQGAILYANTRVLAYISGKLSEHLLQGILNMPYQWIASQNPTDLFTTIKWAPGATRFIDGVFNLGSNALIVIFIFIAIIAINPPLVLSCIAVLGVIGVTIFFFFKKRLDGLSSQLTVLGKSANRHLARGINGAKDIKIFGKEESFTREFLQNIYTVPYIDARLKFYNQLPGWIIESLGIAALCGGTFYMHLSGGYTATKIAGTITLIAVASWRILPAIVKILSLSTIIRNNIPYVVSTLKMFDTVNNAHATSQEKLTSCTLNERYSLRNIYYTYPNASKQALTDVSFTIEKGQTIGIIGPSGAGKSTLTDIMIGLLEPSSGEVVIDETLLTASNRRSWLNRIGYVPQSPYMFDGSLAENIAFETNADAISKEKVKRYCSMAAINDFLTELPDGIDSQIGELATRLSGGQKQRVCIARALYREPNILFLDEATSALDTHNEKLIQKTIAELKGQLTIVIIAHRLTTVEDCDLLVWMDQGKVRMVAPPEQVLKQYEKYAPTENNIFTENENRV